MRTHLSLVALIALLTACTVPDKFFDDGGGGDDDAADLPDANTPDADDIDAAADVTAPETTITQSPPAIDNSTSVEFRFISSESMSNFDCQLDDRAQAPCTSPSPWSGLPNGAHTFSVFATDRAGNADMTPARHMWTIDTSTPDTTITSGPADFAATTTATFTFLSPGAPAATFDCALDAAAFATCPPSHTLTNVAEGPHTFYVRARLATGSVDPTPASRMWTVDTVRPDTTIIGGPSGAVTTPVASFMLMSTEPGTFECKLDTAADFSACPAAYTITVNEGSHTLLVRAVDAAGNADLLPATRTWSVDTGLPETTIDSHPTYYSNSASATFTFSSPDAGTGATFECKLDTAAFSTCVSPRTLSGLGEGDHTFEVRVRDVSGNYDPFPATWAWIVDTVLPDTTIVSGPPVLPAVANTTAATFDFSSNEGPVTYQCRPGTTGTFVDCDDPHTRTVAQGAQVLQVVAIDAAGNRDASPATWMWTVDSIAPDTTLATSGPTGAVTLTTATFTFSSPEAGATFECQRDTAAFATCTSGTVLTGFVDGMHTFTVRAKDAAGNVDTTPPSRMWTVDTLVPDTIIDTGPTGTVALATATFTFSSPESGATFECALDTATFTTCTSPRALSALAQGSHTFTVRARDAAGNMDASPAARTWTVDTAAPDTTLDATFGPIGSVSSTTATFRFSSPDTSAVFDCKLDTATFALCTSDVTLTVLGQGLHTFTVRARDAAGNVDAIPPSRMWTVDTAAPDTMILTGPPVLPVISNTTSAAFDFSSNETSVTYECRLGTTGAFASCLDPHTRTVGQGPQTLQVQAIDAAGNHDTTPASWTWTVDSVAPDTTIVSGPPTPNLLGMTTFDFSSNETPVQFECSLNVGTATTVGFSSCPDPYRVWIGTAVDTTYTMRVRARDTAMNVGPPTVHTWTTDLANIAFVTSGFLGTNLAQYDTNAADGVSGLVGADNVCNERARNVGLEGTYVAYLSASTSPPPSTIGPVHAYTRLGGAQGWIRVDGKPFANSVQDIIDGKLFTPLRMDERGDDSVNNDYSAMTGTMSNGEYDTADGTCRDWTVGDDFTVRGGAGTPRGTTDIWVDNQGSTIGCGGNLNKLYCFGVSYSNERVAPPPPGTNRRVFVSARGWTPTTAGRNSADAQCQSDATAAGLPGTYLAALATSTEGALSRFSTTGAPWVRVDGMPVTATAATLLGPTLTWLDTSLNVQADGTYVHEQSASADHYWSGPRMTPLGTDIRHCSNWTSSSSLQQGMVGRNADTRTDLVFTTSYSTACNQARRLLCFQR